jgi:hypothetical protein
LRHEASSWRRWLTDREGLGKGEESELKEWVKVEAEEEEE